MPDIFIGRQWVTERRQWLVRVVADSVEDAQMKLDNGDGVAYAYVASEVVSEDAITDVHVDLNS